jgi:hypothetical protein
MSIHQIDGFLVMDAVWRLEHLLAFNKPVLIWMADSVLVRRGDNSPSWKLLASMLRSAAQRPNVAFALGAITFDRELAYFIPEVQQALMQLHALSSCRPVCVLAGCYLPSYC